MSQYTCLKIITIKNLIKKLEKIKIIIKDCSVDRTQRMESIFSREVNTNFNEEDKKKQLEELDKRLKLYKKKYVLLHNKLYNVVEILLSCPCCKMNDHNCERDGRCLKSVDNDKVWEIVDHLHNDLQNFYDEVETMLVVETEICLHKLNKIKKIKFFDDAKRV